MKNRPELEKAIDQLGTGNILIVAEWDRATRSMFDGIEIIKRIHARGALIKVLDKPHLDLTTPLGRGFIAFQSAMAEDERGRIAAKAKGTRFGRKPSTSRSRPSSASRPAKAVDQSPRRWPCTTPRWRDWQGRGGYRAGRGLIGAGLGPIGASRPRAYGDGNRARLVGHRNHDPVRPSLKSTTSRNMILNSVCPASSSTCISRSSRSGLPVRTALLMICRMPSIASPRAACRSG
jgi:Resolvase, N terminal domain